MKKILLLLTLFGTSCGNIVEPRTNVLKTSSIYQDRRIEILTFEGHEYIHVGVGQDGWGAHSGSCKHPIHKFDRK